MYFQVSRQLRAIRAAGLPASAQELDRWYAQVPDSSNAAVVLVKAFDLLKTFPDARSNQIAKITMPGRGKRLTPDEQALVAEYLAMNAEALALAQQAVQLHMCRYPVDLTGGLFAYVPHLARLKQFAEAVYARAVLVSEGKTHGKWPDEVRFMLQLAQTLENEPLLISQLVRCAIISSAVKLTEYCLNSAAVTAGFEALDAAFARAENTNALRLAFIGERACAISSFRLSWSDMKQLDSETGTNSSETKPTRLSGTANPLLWLSGILERELNFYLRVMETNIAIVGLPPPASLKAGALAGQFQNVANRKRYFLVRLMLPGVGNASIHNADTFARIRLARTAVAIERFRAMHNRLPDSLDELVPELLPAVPADPFDGEPIRYRRLEKGYLIYSVSKDGKDDAGRERSTSPRAAKTETYDISFTVER